MRFAFERNPAHIASSTLRKLDAAVYVLHCFGKKTQATRKADVDLASKRYRALMKEQR